MKALIGLTGGLAVMAMVGAQGMSGNVLGLGGLMMAACWIVSGWLID